jgi:sulfatase modifying factor 1
MVFIPGGEFVRGRTHALPDDGLKWFPELLKDDQPAKPITIDPFYLDVHEVTNSEYARFVTATKHRPPYNWPEGKVAPGNENFPVSAVSWDDAMAYAKWAGKRLPTEAEWERACRGLTDKQKYSWGDAKPTAKLAHFGSVDGPQDVGKCAANGFGLYDMAGNVWEWMADWYDQHYYDTAPDKNPTGPPTGMYRVLRGGSWADVAKYLTCSYRSWARPAERSPNIGFRCAKSFHR